MKTEGAPSYEELDCLNFAEVFRSSDVQELQKPALNSPNDLHKRGPVAVCFRK